MDTDVELIRNLDDLLHYQAFSGFESKTAIPTGIMASEQGGVWATEQLAYYENRHFVLPDESLDLTTNVEIISKNMAVGGFRLDNTYQVYKNSIHIFPKDFFCPKTPTGVLCLTENTYCIHHFASSWETPKVKAKMFLIRKVFGPAMTQRLILYKRRIFIALGIQRAT